MQNLIITTNEIKKEILLKRSEDKIISNTKILTLNEVKNIVLGEINPLAVIELAKEFNLSLNASKVYIENILYNGDKLSVYYNFLLAKELVKKGSLIKFDNIKVINVMIDDYIIKYFSNSNIQYYKFEEEYNHNVVCFKNVEEEILYVVDNIIKLNIPLKKIKLVEVKPEYKKIIKKIFRFHNIPVNIDITTGINKTTTFNEFYTNLVETRDLYKSLETIKKGEVYNKIINYFNNSNFDSFDDLTLKYIYDDFKNISKPNIKNKDAVECISLKEMYNQDNYYFLLGFNDSFPTVYKDEDFYTDIEKEKIGLLTSVEKNKLSKKQFLNLFNGIKNLFITFSEESTFTKYNKSMFIKDYNINIIKNDSINLCNSDEFNRIHFAKLLDNFIKFGEKTNDLSLLNNTYAIDYLTYSNKFTGLSKNKVNYPFTLSYSSVKTYYECSFKYYIEKILKINSVEKSLAIDIGNVYHMVLSKIYEEDFNFDKIYNEELEKLNISYKDLFFLENLKSELDKIIEFLREFNKETFLNKNLCENEFIIENIIPNKVHFKGFIDNIKYSDIYQLMILIDYKTGSVEATLDNINHGFNLQLPSYLYLVNKKLPDYKVVGTYLDKILDAPTINEDEKAIRNKLKLVGYSTSNVSDLLYVDPSYENSNYIKSLKTSSKGFYPYSKVLDQENFSKVTEIAEEKIINAANNILNAEFEINPKEIKKVVEKCKYCKYSDICYMTNEDVINLENTKLMDLL